MLVIHIFSYSHNVLESFLLHINSVLCGKGLTLSQTSPDYLRVCSRSLLKTLRKGETALPVISNFSFSHSVFYPLEDFSAIFIKFKSVTANCFSLEAF